MNSRCFLVDDAGYIVSHYDWTDTSHDMSDVHITRKEPEIASILIQHDILNPFVCTNVIEIRNQYFWKVNDSTA